VFFFSSGIIRTMFGDNPNKADVYACPSDYFGSPESEPLTIVYRRPRVHDMCYINTQHDNGIMFVWLLSLSGVPSSSQNKLSKVYKEVFLRVLLYRSPPMVFHLRHVNNCINFGGTECFSFFRRCYYVVSFIGL
jgi:hypothetical protein